MPAGFFTSSNLKAAAQAHEPLLPRCGACGLFQGCKSPKMPPTGQGKRRVLIVAEAPGQTEDEQGTQLVGKAGQLLRRCLADLGVNLDTDCWKTNAIICHPPDNRTPTDAELDHCLPNYRNTVKEFDPDVIIPLGGPALKTVLRGLWREDIGGITRWAGMRIPSQRPNVWVCPTYHPSYVLRFERDRALQLWFRRHLAAAFALHGKPWGDDNPPPDYGSQIEAVWEPAKAARILDQMIVRGGTVAVDYETNMLKPDGPDAAIECCAVCWEGKRTIAYPWVGEAIAATGRLLASPLGKIASNMKFEDRWTRRHFGHRVRNWVWDTMQGAHVLDTRRGITSIKFQALVRLGFPVYDNDIKPFLEAPGTRVKNRVKAIDKRELFHYCGLDSLLEYHVAMQQMKELEP